MRKARILVAGSFAAVLEECSGGRYQLTYSDDYHGAPVSLTMPIARKIYEFDHFPAFFEGLLPEGMMLEALLRKYKIDRDDYFSQLIIVGHDLVGSVTVEEIG